MTSYYLDSKREKEREMDRERKREKGELYFSKEFVSIPILLLIK